MSTAARLSAQSLSWKKLSGLQLSSHRLAIHGLRGRHTGCSLVAEGNKPGHRCAFRERSLVWASARTTTEASEEAEGSVPIASFRVGTWNLLCPKYYRVPRRPGDADEGGSVTRESKYPDAYSERARRIMQYLEEQGLDVACFQEVWLENEEYVKTMKDHLEENGYALYSFERTGGRGDGLATAVRTSKFKVLGHHEIPFMDCGDRIAQMLILETIGDWEPIARRVKRKRSFLTQAAENICNDGDDECNAVFERMGERLESLERRKQQHSNKRFILINTHLLFPHNANSSLIRLREVYKLMDFIRSFKEKYDWVYGNLPIILCGDFNGSRSGQVYQYLRNLNFKDSTSVFMSQQGSADRPWITHFNHNQQAAGVDFIWYLNTSDFPWPTHKADWMSAIYAMASVKMHEAGLCRNQDAFSFFDADCDNRVTVEDFEQAMNSLGLCGEGTVGLTKPEICQLVEHLNGSSCEDPEAYRQRFIEYMGVECMEDAYKRIQAATGITEEAWIDESTSAPRCLLPSAGKGQQTALDVATAIANNVVQPAVPEDGEDSDRPGRFKLKSAGLHPESNMEGQWTPPMCDETSLKLTDHALLVCNFDML